MELGLDYRNAKHLVSKAARAAANRELGRPAAWWRPQAGRQIPLWAPGPAWQPSDAPRIT